MNNNIYHFTTIDSLIKIFLSNSFLLNNIDNMNDLTESKNIYDNNWIGDFEGTRKKINFRGNTFLEMLEYKEKLIGNVKFLKQNTFICSFNKLKNKESIYEKFSLWGHYANKSNGVAIQFNQDKLDNLFKKLIKENYTLGINGKVKYRNYQDLEEINDKAIKLLADDKLKKLLTLKYFNKSIEWKQENEYRLLICLIKSKEEIFEIHKKYIYIFNIIECIEEVIVGANVDESGIILLNHLKEKIGINIKFSHIDEYKIKNTEEEKNEAKLKRLEINEKERMYFGKNLSEHYGSIFWQEINSEKCNQIEKRNWAKNIDLETVL